MFTREYGSVYTGDVLIHGWEIVPCGHSHGVTTKASVVVPGRGIAAYLHVIREKKTIYDNV